MIMEKSVAILDEKLLKNGAMGAKTHPPYIGLLKSGELLARIEAAYRLLRSCDLCPRACGINRLRGELGICRVGKIASIASVNLHFGEEPPVSGTRGSGAIFFAGCNLRCRFCQNYPISQMGHGKLSSPAGLAEKMLWLQGRGAHNINLVTPSHVVPQFLAALFIAASSGLKLPFVYNCSGYDGMDALKLLDGIVDIYMPDIKYAAMDKAGRCSDAPDYWDWAKKATHEMYRQVGPLVTDKNGIGKRGLMIRHLVLPGGLGSANDVFKFIATKLSKDVPVSLMSQYFPADRALGDAILGRKITREEFNEAKEALHKWGLTKGWIQEID